MDLLTLFTTQCLLNVPEAATKGVLLKKVFLKILQNAQENTYTRVFLIKLPASGLQLY